MGAREAQLVELVDSGGGDAGFLHGRRGAADAPYLDPAEVADMRWLAPDRADDPGRYAPWLGRVLPVAIEASSRPA